MNVIEWGLTTWCGGGRSSFSDLETLSCNSIYR